MAHDALKTFLTAPAPAGAGHLLREGKTDNLALIEGLYYEITRILRKPDAGGTSLTFRDAMRTTYAYAYLQAMVQGKTSARFGLDTLERFTQSARTVCSEYYAPRISIAQTTHQTAKAGYNKLEAQFEHLMALARHDDAALATLHDTFYPDADWDPDLAMDLADYKNTTGNVIDFKYLKLRRRARDSFRAVLQNDPDQNPIHPYPLSLDIPEIIIQNHALMQSSGRTLERLQAKLDAVETFLGGFSQTLRKPSATVRILRHPASAKRAGRPVLQP